MKLPLWKKVVLAILAYLILRLIFGSFKLVLSIAGLLLLLAIGDKVESPVENPKTV